MANPVFVTPADGQFQQSDQPSVFGSLELQGLKIFLAEIQGKEPTSTELPPVGSPGEGSSAWVEHGVRLLP